MPEIKLNSKTDKLETVTHIVSKQLTENNGEIHTAQAAQEAIEKMEDVDESVTGRFTQHDFSDLVSNNTEFSTKEDQYGQQVITDVETIGTHPDFLELKAQPNNTGDEGSDGIFGGSDLGEDDFSELNAVSQHQPEALKDAGFNTFRDLYEAEVSELTEVPGVKKAKAKDIQDEASQRIDAIVEIAREAYEDEMEIHTENDNEVTLGDDRDITANDVTDVKVPAGKPRGPEYNDTIEPRFAYDAGGLPVLEYPTVTGTIIENQVEKAENIHEFVNGIKQLTKYDVQAEAFEEAVTDTFNTLADVEEAVTEPKDIDVLDDIRQQVGVEVEVLQSVIDEHEDLIEKEGFTQSVVNTIDADMKGDMPVKTRLAMMEEMKAKSESVSDNDELVTDDAVDEYVEASEAPIEIDHPFIDDLDEFPELKTREMPTGNTELEEIGKVIAKNVRVADLMGHAGVGKDTILKVIFAATNRPHVGINMDKSMISQELMGSYKIDEDGKVYFKDGVVPHCGKYGFNLIISEINAAHADIISALHQVTEKNGKIHVKQKDEVIEPSPKFRIVTTRNPPTQSYNSMKEMNDAFEGRLKTFRIGYLDPDDEVDLLDEMVNNGRKIIDRNEIKTLVEILNEFREMADNDEGPRLSTRMAEKIANSYDGNDDLLATTLMTLESKFETCEYDAESLRTTVKDKFH